MGKIKQIIAQYGDTLENTYPVTLAEAVMYYKDGKLSSLKDYLDDLKIETTGEYLPATKLSDFYGYDTYNVDSVVFFGSSVFFGTYMTEYYGNRIIPGDYSVTARYYVGEGYENLKKVGTSIEQSNFSYYGLSQTVNGNLFDYYFPQISSNTDDVNYSDRTLATTVMLLNPDTERLGSDIYGRYYSWNSNETGSKDMLWGVKCLNYKYNTSSKLWEAENNDYIDIMGIYMSGTPQNSTDGKYMALWVRDLLVAKNLNCTGNIKTDNYLVANRGLKLWCDYDTATDFEGKVVDYRLSSPYSTSENNIVAVDTDIHAGGIKITKESDSTSVIYRFPKKNTTSTVPDYTLATTKDIEEQIANLVGSAPESLNTLKELADAIEKNQDIINTLNSAIRSKQNTITGAATTIASNNLTTNRVVVSSNSGKVATSNITSTELNYLSGVKTGIQIQLDRKAASSHSHKNIEHRGVVAMETGTERPAVSGLSMTKAYNNGYPTSYGNVINLSGRGDGQILVGWSGIDGAHAPMYVRSRRDQKNSPWSEWAKVYTSAYKPTLSELGLNTVTQTTQGLMSAADKVKLDGIATNANKITIDSTLSTTSTNPVQNSIITNTLNKKANLYQLGETENAEIWQTFATVRKTNLTDDMHAMFLVSGMGDFSGTKQGSCLVSVSNRGSVATMDVTVLSSWDTGSAVFGYYEQNSNFYFGIYCAKFRGNLTIVPIQNNKISITFSDKLTTRPTGWTNVTPKFLKYTDNDYNVKQTSSTSTTELPLLAAGNANPNGSATTACYNTSIKMKPSAGSITATAFYQASDINKKDIHGNINTSIEDILSIPTIEFNYKEDDKTHIGTIAQEVEKVCPEIVQTDSEGFKLVDYAKLSVLAIKALKDTYGELSTLKEEVKQIKALLHGKV